MGTSASSGAGATAPGPRRLRLGVIRISVLVAAVVLAVSVTACGGGSKHKSTTTGTSGAHTTGTTTASAPLPGIVAFTDLADDGLSAPQSWRVTIYGLRHDGPFVTLDFAARCTVPGSVGCDGGAFFNQNEVIQGPPGEMTLIDPNNNEQYWPVTDAQSDTYASMGVGGLASTPLTLFWVTFPAPPASVKTLDVAFPKGGPQVPDIPITTAASGPTPSQVGHGAVAAPPNKFAVPPGTTNTTGLTLTSRPLVLGVGNPKGSDAESAGHSMITLSSDVLFHFDKSNLTPAARSILTTVAARIKAGAHGVVSVTGYTDSIGTDAVNIPLSQARARSVVSFLSPLTGGSSVTYSSRGLGSSDPVAPNTNRDGSDNPAGRALNRRVTIGYGVSAPVKPSPPAASTAPAASSSTAASLTAKFTVDNFGTDTYGVKIGSLFRDGDMAVLRLSVNCLMVTGNSGLPCDGIENLGGDNSIPPSPGYKSIDGLTYRTVSGFYLQDASGNDYVPVYARSSNDPVTAETNQYIGTTPFSLWVYFPAPPATDSSVTVFAPGGLAKVGGVPISASAPPLP